ncbi:DUF1501 domain-containing protein [Thalassobius sp. MITS945101]|uniref:DUF1501 domain-containing protein n=1 Tax=Thalassobius sp. MITS945101 TaxID=3096994 RepID=UPI00399AA124
MSKTDLNRRAFLGKAGLLGCSLAASPLMTPISLAAAPWDHRLVVIILRGGMDGLDVVRPVGDPGFVGLRRSLGQTPGLPLDGFYEMHPGLVPLHALWQRQQLGFVQAVSTPYRDKRSHFDGQDLLEAGTSDPHMATARDGWLNRMLQTVPGLTTETAYAVGHENMMLLSGAAAAANWSPDTELALSPQGARLAELIMHDDPAFHAAFMEAQMLIGLQSGAVPQGMSDADMMGAMADMGDEGMMAESATNGRPAGIEAIANFTAQRLREETRIAAFSIGGWDTHRAQGRGLERALGQLSKAILTLKSGLGRDWSKTAVVAMTEFGRTARENGTAGTDHGTGGAMLLAGGAVRGGRVYGQWPGLSEADLYARRDLMPTADVRGYAGWMMRDLFGLETSVIERSIFPGLDLGTSPKVIL